MSMKMKTFDESCPWCDGPLSVTDAYDGVYCMKVGCGYVFDFVERSDDESDVVGSDDTEDDPDPSHQNLNDCSWFEITNGLC